MHEFLQHVLNVKDSANDQVRSAGLEVQMRFSAPSDCTAEQSSASRAEASAWLPAGKIYSGVQFWTELDDSYFHLHTCLPGVLYAHIHLGVSVYTLPCV